MDKLSLEVAKLRFECLLYSKEVSKNATLSQHFQNAIKLSNFILHGEIPTEHTDTQN